MPKQIYIPPIKKTLDGIVRRSFKISRGIVLSPENIYRYFPPVETLEFDVVMQKHPVFPKFLGKPMPVPKEFTLFGFKVHEDPSMKEGRWRFSKS